MDGGETDDEFEERFLQCFGLSDPEALNHLQDSEPVVRTPSQPDLLERDEQLKCQAAMNSPWLVVYMYKYIHVQFVSGWPCSLAPLTFSVYTKRGRSIVSEITSS